MGYIEDIRALTGPRPLILVSAGVLVVDGPWTTSTLQAMVRVFDYVVPIARVGEVVEVIRDYLNGDTTKLHWLIEFRILPA